VRVNAADHLRAKVAQLRAENQRVAEYRRFKRGPFDFTLDQQRNVMIEIYETVADALEQP
jgi:hypothetical protein